MLSVTPKLLSGIEDSHHRPNDAMHNTPQPLKVSQKTLVLFLTEITLISIDSLTPKHQSDTKVFRMTMEILPEPTSHKLYDASVMRTASAAAKPCQGDSSEFYLVTDLSRTMATTAAQQIALDNALVAPDK
ncbi:hypothetical protein Tco_0719857 [Tanacetum coccineum]